MNALNHLRACLLLLGLLVALHPLPSSAQSSKERDGQHDFGFEIGSCGTHLSRLLHPLAGSPTWTDYEGSTVVREVWDGRANLVTLPADGPAGHIAALSLRLYNPQSRQWSLDFATSKSGALDQPAIGEFKNGRGRAILVRFVISDISPNSCRFEQAFSEDGGKAGK
jgi:hypothetical protein